MRITGSLTEVVNGSAKYILTANPVNGLSDKGTRYEADQGAVSVPLRSPEE